MLTDSLLILALILLNGAFALSEIAIVSARRGRLTQMAESGRSGAARALALSDEPTRFLSSVQVGITSIGILSGAIGEATLAGHVRRGLEQVPGLSAYSQPLGLAVVVVGVAYVSLILGELVPKRLALVDPERVAALIARPMQVVARVARPIVYVLTASTNAVLRLFGVHRVEPEAVTMEEIKITLEQGTRQGVLEGSEHDMMTNVLNLDERNVSSVRTPRSEIVFVDVRNSSEENRRRLRAAPHDVLPLCEDGLDRVVGVVRISRVLEQMLEGREMDLRTIAEPALFVPETMTLLTLLEQIKRTSLPTALVVDEFGQVDGIVSLSDVISAIVGDLPVDGEPQPEIVQREDGSWLIDGGLELEAVSRKLQDESLVEGLQHQPFHTLGGLAMAAVGRVPRTGDVFERGRYRFEVVDMDGNRVDRVLATRLQGDPA